MPINGAGKAASVYIKSTADKKYWSEPPAVAGGPTPATAQTGRIIGPPLPQAVLTAAPPLRVWYTLEKLNHHSFLIFYGT